MGKLTATDQLTMVELAKRSGATDDQRQIIELLAENNEVLKDAPAVEANDGTTDVTVQRTSLPHGTHRAFNQGVAPAASQTKTIQEVCCELTAICQIDASLVKKAQSREQLIQSEINAFLEGMAQDQADDFFYGDHQTDKRYIDGFAKRRAAIDGTHCIDAGGTGSELTSLYIIMWAQNKARLIYPRGSSSIGIEHTDMGLQLVDDGTGTGAKYKALVHEFSASYGISMKDDRALIRIANIPATMGGDDLAKMIVKALPNLPSGSGNISILCNKKVKSLFDVAVIDKSNVILPAEDPWGKRIATIADCRVRCCDAILNTESAVA